MFLFWAFTFKLVSRGGGIFKDPDGFFEQNFKSAII